MRRPLSLLVRDGARPRGFAPSKIRGSLAAMRLAPLACMALIGCSPASAVENPPSVLHEVRIIDGDTFTLDGETIRIANIDAPESGSRAKCWAEARLATQARWALEMAASQWRFRAPDLRKEGQDRYGRTLARVFTDGEDVGEALIKSGHVAPWIGRRWEWCGPITNNAAGDHIINARPDAFTALMTEPAA